MGQITDLPKKLRHIGTATERTADSLIDEAIDPGLFGMRPFRKQKGRRDCRRPLAADADKTSASASPSLTALGTRRWVPAVRRCRRRSSQSA
jgi:hypothetical protein